MRRLVLARVLLLGVVPTASACSAIVPPLLERLEWLPEGTLLGSAGGRGTGRVSLDEGVVEPAYGAAGAWSPDGRHLVFPRRGPDVQVGPLHREDSCGGHLSRHLVAYDRHEDRFRLVDPGPVWGVASTPEGIVAYDGRVARVWAWGSWELVREERARGVVEPHRWRGFLDERTPPASPDGARRVETHEKELRVVDARDGRELARRAFEARVGGVAWSPMGDALAVAVGANDTHARLHVLDAGRLATREEVPVVLGGADEVVAWWQQAWAEVPVPEYSLGEKLRATPAPLPLLALVVALALSRRARGTSKAPRP